MKPRLPLAALLCVVWALPAQAFLGDDEARRGLVELRREHDARLAKLEAGSRSQFELINQIEQLNAEVAKLRGQVEVLTHDLENLQKRQRDFYVDLDNRLRKLESGAAAAEQAPAPQPAADAAGESREFEAALNLFKQGKHAEAVGAFEAFIKNRPASNLLPGAHFWAGQSAYQSRDVARSITHFNAVLSRWPSDPRAPDAQLGLANAQQAMGDAKASRRSLELLVEKYPASDAAAVAKQRLAR